MLRHHFGCVCECKEHCCSEQGCTAEECKCKDLESEDGFLARNFFDLEMNKKYRFSSGPFTDRIFQIINLQRNRIKILMGNIKTTIKNKEFLFTPV